MRVPSRRTLAGVVGLTAAIAFVAAAAGGDGSPPGDGVPAASARSTTTSSSPPGSTTSTTTSPDSTAPPSSPPVTPSSAQVDFVAEPIGDRRAVFVTPNETVVLDLDRNEMREARHDEPLSVNYESPLAVSGDAVFFLSRRQLLVTSLSNLVPLRPIGDGLLMVVSSTPGRVWVARERGTGYALEEVDATGATRRTSARLPDDASPIAVSGDRVVMHLPDGALTVWDVATGATTWSSPVASQVLDARGGVVVWRRDCRSRLCALHVTEVATGRDRTIPSIVDGAEYYPEFHAVSPSGRYLATMVGTGEEGPTPFKLRVVDLESGLVGEADAFEAARLYWSPDGRWVFIGGDGNPSRPLRWAFRIDGLDIRRVNVNVPSDGEAIAVAVA